MQIINQAPPIQIGCRQRMNFIKDVGKSQELPECSPADILSVNQVQQLCCHILCSLATVAKAHGYYSIKSNLTLCFICYKPVFITDQFATTM